jgi:hypothetical protein
MSIITNGNLGPVYQPDYFEARQVLAADSALTVTPTVEPTFSFNVLKNERVSYRLTLFFDQDNAGDDLQYTINTVDSAGGDVVPAFFSSTLIAVVPGGASLTSGATTTIDQEDTVVSGATGQGMAVIQGVIHGNATTDSTFQVELAQEAANATTTVQEGSFLELRRF